MADPAAEEARGLRAPVNAPAALARQLGTAIRTLTILPAPGAPIAVGQSALFFPLVGLLLGGVLAAADAGLAGVLPRAGRDLALVTILVALTGARTLRALAAAVRALADGRGRNGGAAAVLAVAAIVLVIGVELRSLAALTGYGRVLALFLAPMLGRWAMVALVNGALAARPDGPGAELVRTVTFREFGIASVSAFAVTLAWAEARGLVLVLTLAAFTIGVRILAHQRLGGVTEDVAGAIAALGEALVLGVCALLAPTA